MTGAYEFTFFKISTNSANVPDFALDCVFLMQSADYIHVIVPTPSLF